jgi:hypothetical protein
MRKSGLVAHTKAVVAEAKTHLHLQRFKAAQIFRKVSRHAPAQESWNTPALTFDRSPQSCNSVCGWKSDGPSGKLGMETFAGREPKQRQKFSRLRRGPPC